MGGVQADHRRCGIKKRLWLMHSVIKNESDDHESVTGQQNDGTSLLTKNEIARFERKSGESQYSMPRLNAKANQQSIGIKEFAALFAATVTKRTKEYSWIAKNGPESLFSAFAQMLPQVSKFGIQFV
jgi:hypothetical protein